MTPFGMYHKPYCGFHHQPSERQIRYIYWLYKSGALNIHVNDVVAAVVMVCIVLLACPNMVLAQKAGEQTIQVVSLDTDPDINTWVNGIKEYFDAIVVANVRTLDFKRADLHRGFANLGDWVFLGGHFTDDYWHHDQDVNIGPRLRVLTDMVTVEQDGNKLGERERPEEYVEHSEPRYIFLRGCGTLKDERVVQRYREFFARPDGTPPVLIGWLDDTGWQISEAILGGFGNKPPMPRRDFFDRLPQEDIDEHDVIEAWLGAVAETFWGKGSTVETSASCIDSIGVEWIIKDDEIVQSDRRF